jgi:hypothetical protein
LVITYLGNENVIAIVVECDEKLLLPLLMEWNKLSILANVEVVENLQSQIDVEYLFHITTHVETCMDFMSREPVWFLWYPIDVENCKCTISWWHKE